MTDPQLLHRLSTLWFKYRGVDRPARRHDYTDSSDRNRQILVSNQLHFSPASQFNDPFELQPKVVFSSDGVANEREVDEFVAAAAVSSEEERLKLREWAMAEACEPESAAVFRQQAEQRIRDRLVRIALCCFSRRGDDILLWSHYADSHAGFAVGLDFSISWPMIVPMPQGPLHTTLNLMPVDYGLDYPQVDLDQLLAQKVNAEQFARAALCTKFSGWAYEQEARVALMDMPAGPYSFPPEMLRAVVLGARMLPAERERIIDLALSRPNPPMVLEAKIAPDRFGLDLVVVSSA